MPRHVQKDPEASLTWVLKDELVRRGRVYYARLARGRTMFVAPRLIPHFHAVWGIRRGDEPGRLSRNAQAVLRAHRKEWEMSTGDLRDESGVKDRKAFTAAMDELQIARAFLAGAGLTVPGELARVTGLSRPDAGRGHHALVAEGYAVRTARGT